MSVLSEKAELSRKYTNYSLRATSVYLLDAANIPTRHIMSVTGHKAESSLKTYTGHTDNNTKKLVSNIITELLDSKLEPVTNSQYDELMDQLDADPEFDQILADLPSINSEATCAISSNNCVTPVTPAGVSNVFSCNYQWNTRFQPYPQPMITGQNAHVTINYNIFNN